MKTKVTIDRKFTDEYMMERTKEHVAEFREMWTPGDLLRMFKDAIEEVDPVTFVKICNTSGDDIIRCEASAFNGGWQEEDTTHYSVEITAEEFDRFTKISFYITHTGNVNTRKIYMGEKYGGWEPLYKVKVYKLEK